MKVETKVLVGITVVTSIILVTTLFYTIRKQDIEIADLRAQLAQKTRSPVFQTPVFHGKFTPGNTVCTFDFSVAILVKQEGGTNPTLLDGTAVILFDDIGALNHAWTRVNERISSSIGPAGLRFNNGPLIVYKNSGAQITLREFDLIGEILMEEFPESAVKHTSKGKIQ